MNAIRHHDHTAPAAGVGTDISKDTLDACRLPEHDRPRCRRFRNDPDGHAALLAWADTHAPAGQALGFCLESTGTYGTALATTLAHAGRDVSVVNPARIKYAGLASGRGNKTDKADALLIAQYSRDRRPPPGGPRPRNPANCRPWCVAATTCAPWRRARRGGGRHPA